MESGGGRDGRLERETLRKSHGQTDTSDVLKRQQRPRTYW